jgi:hypothetical protein
MGFGKKLEKGGGEQGIAPEAQEKSACQTSYWVPKLGMRLIEAQKPFCESYQDTSSHAR